MRGQYASGPGTKKSGSRARKSILSRSNTSSTPSRVWTQIPSYALPLNGPTVMLHAGAASACSYSMRSSWNAAPGSPTTSHTNTRSFRGCSTASAVRASPFASFTPKSLMEICSTGARRSCSRMRWSASNSLFLGAYARSTPLKPPTTIFASPSSASSTLPTARHAWSNSSLLPQVVDHHSRARNSDMADGDETRVERSRDDRVQRRGKRDARRARRARVSEARPSSAPERTRVQPRDPPVVSLAPPAVSDATRSKRQRADRRREETGVCFRAEKSEAREPRGY